MTAFDRSRSLNRRPVIAAGCALLLATSPLLAQAATAKTGTKAHSSASSIVAAAAADAASAADAHAAVVSLQSAMQKATSLSFAGTADIPSVASAPVSVTGTVARPNLANIAASIDGKQQAVIVSDGKDFTAYSPTTGHYLKLPSSAGLVPESASLQPFVMTETGAPAFSAAIVSVEQFLRPHIDLSEMPTPPGGAKKYTVTKTTTVIGGKPASVLTQTVLYSKGSSTQVFQTVMAYAPATLAVLKSVVRSGPTAGQLKSLFTINYTKYAMSAAAAPDLSAFAFTPPATATAFAAPPAGADASGGALAAGKTAPDFTVQTPDGKLVKLSDYSGKVVVLDLWATWCGPCQASLPHTDALAKVYRPKGVVFMPVCVSDTKEAFTTWLTSHSALTMSFLYDPAGRTGESFSNKLYGADSIPTQFVVGKDGKIVATFVGYDSDGDPTEKSLAAAIDKAIAAT